MNEFICYPKCTTCQKAKKWLDDNKIEYGLRDIKQDNPSFEELSAWYKMSGLPLKKFFNTSGLLYKSMELKDKLPTMSDEEQLKLLATDGMLVKRPLVIGKDFVLENNLNYQTLAKNVELAKRNVHMAGWAYGPTIGVGYQYSQKDYFGEKEGFNMTPPNALSIQISMPLWSSGKRAAGVVEKKIALEEARNTFAETTDNLGIQNEQLRYNLQNAYETYTNEQENITVTQRVFDNTTLKFQQGVASNLELVNASNDLITAQSTYVQAVLTLVNAQVELEKFLNM